MNNDIKPLSEHVLLREMDVNGINNPTRKARDLLTESELNCFWTLCLQCEGPLTLRKIYGDYWWSIRGPRKFGLRFSNTFLAGKLPGLERVEGKSASHVYDWPKREEKVDRDAIAANDATIRLPKSMAA